MTTRPTNRLFSSSFAYVALAGAIFAMTFFGVCSPNQSQFGPGGPAGAVDDEEIPANEFRLAYENTLQRYQRVYGGADFDPAAMRLAEMVLNNLVDQRVTYVQAKRAGVFASDAEVEEIILEQFKDEKGKFDAENFSDALRYRGFTEASYMEQVKRDLTVNKYRQLISETAFISSSAAVMDYKLSETKLNVEYLKLDQSKIKVSVLDKEIEEFLKKDDSKKKLEDYYNKNKSEYHRPAQVRARHILVGHKDARRASDTAKKRTKDQARKRAEELLKQVKSSGKSFVTLATQNTDEASGKQKGGDLGFFKREDMVKEFSDVAFKLKKDEVSGVVESPFGFHIIKVIGMKKERKQTLVQAKNSIAIKILEKEKAPAVVKKRGDVIVAKLNKKQSIRSELADYKLKWESTGKFSVNTSSLPKLGTDEKILAAVESMRTPGAVHNGLIESGGSFYILRLKSFEPADIKKFEKERENMTRSAAYSLGASLFSALNDEYEKKLREKKKIQLNDRYLALDRRESGS